MEKNSTKNYLNQSLLSRLSKAHSLWVVALCLLFSVLYPTQNIVAQCTILANAVQGISYTYVQGTGTNATGLAYNPNLNIYYAVIGGNPTFPLETFDASGVSLYQTTSGFDSRGLWWNQNLNDLEANGFSTLGLWIFDLNGSGYALNTGTNPFIAQNQPDAQSCGSYDCQDDEIWYNFNGTVSNYARGTDALISSFPLTGSPYSLANCNTTSIIYTGCPGNELGIEDYVDMYILLFDKTTGAYSGKSQMPGTAVMDGQYHFAYANNLVWLYDVNTRTWTSYSIFAIVSDTAVVNLGPDTTLCGGQTLVLNAGNAGASYIWQDGSTNQTFTVTQAGTYYVAVNTGSCLIAHDTIVVSYASGNSIDLLGDGSTDTTLCTGNSLLLNATTQGATGYVWQDNSTGPTYNVTTAGTYSVTATISGCTASGSVNVAYSPPPVVSLGNDTTLCNGSTLTLNATTAGATYQWQDGTTNPTYTVSTAGTYSVTVSIGSCTASGSINVAYTSPPVVNLGGNVTLCPGQSVLLDATNVGATYLWQDGSTTATYTATSAGTYSVTVSESGCSASGSIAVSYAAPIVIALGNDTTLCTGGTLLLDATNAGGTYQWQDGSTNPTYNVTSAGAYSVTVTVGNCSASATVNVSYSPPPVVNLGNNATLCSGQTQVLDATNAGASYEWQDGTTTATYTVSTAGTYSVTVSVGGCTASGSVNIAYNAPVVVNLGNDTTLCTGGTLLLDATNAGATYQWQDGSSNPTFNVTTAGTYAVTVTVATCTASGSINVAYAAPPVVNLGNDTTLCGGQGLTLDATNAGATYQWQDASTNATYSVTSAGTYSVTVSVGGCTASGSVNVAFAPAIVVSLGNDTTLCGGQSLLLNAGNPGATYLWQDASTAQTYNANATGTYSVTATESGCSASGSIQLTVATPPTINLGNDTTLCTGETLTLNATTVGASYQWQDATTLPTYLVSTAGAYSVTVSVGTCTATGSINVSFSSAPVINLGNSQSLCAGQTTLLSATTAGATYEWQDGSTDSTYLVTYAGNYSVSVTLGVCTATGSVTIAYETPPTIDLGHDTAVCPDDPVILNAYYPSSTYIWQDGSTEPTYRVSKSGTYAVIVTNSCGSTGDSVSIGALDCSHNIFIPNVFTPNNDGKDDYFQLYGNLAFVKYVDVQVYDRIGEKVYETNNPYFTWDGTYKTKPVPNQVLIYQISVAFLDNYTEKIFKGSLTILR